MTHWPERMDEPRFVAAPAIVGVAVGAAATDHDAFTWAMSERLVGLRGDGRPEPVVLMPQDRPAQLQERARDRETACGGPEAHVADVTDMGDPKVQEMLKASGAELLRPPDPRRRTAVFLLPDEFPLSDDDPRWPAPDEDGDVHMSLVADPRQVTVRPMPPECWLRVFLDIDMESPGGAGDLLAFLDRFGPLELPGPLWRTDGAAVRDPADRDPIDPGSAAVLPTLADLGLGPVALRGLRDDIEDVLDELVEAWGYERGEESMVRHRDDDGTWTRLSMTRYRVALQAELLDLYQSVFRTWLHLMEHRPWSAGFLAAEPLAPVADIWDRYGVEVPQSNYAALDAAVAVLNAMTADFGPRVEVLPDDDEYPVGMAIPRIRTALALQVQAWLASDTDVRRCANETCGRWFIQQQGRARYRTPRSKGVLYCSNSCAQAQASRDYRRRRAAQRAES